MVEVFNPFRSPNLPSINRPNLAYYGLGKIDFPKQSSIPINSNRGLQDVSSNYLDRNYNSHNLEDNNHFESSYNRNYKSLSPNMEINSYLNPVLQFNTKLKPKELNQRTYENVRSYNYIQESKKLEGKVGNRVDAQVYNQLKLSNNNQLSNSLDTLKQVSKQTNNHYFDKNHREMVRYPKGHFLDRGIKPSRTKLSSGVPDWFNIVTDESAKKYEDKLKKEDTLFIFSRYQRWITVTPKGKNRKRPLEKAKIQRLEQTSKVMPNWMQIDTKASNPNDNFESQPYTFSMKVNQGKEKRVMLVDKPDSSMKSIFSIGDFRHNVITKESADIAQLGVNNKQKVYFDSNDKNIFDSRLKTDVNKEKLVEFEKRRKEFTDRYEKRFENKNS